MSPGPLGKLVIKFNIVSDKISVAFIEFNIWKK